MRIRNIHAVQTLTLLQAATIFATGLVLRWSLLDGYYSTWRMLISSGDNRAMPLGLAIYMLAPVPAVLMAGWAMFWWLGQQRKMLGSVDFSASLSKRSVAVLVAVLAVAVLAAAVVEIRSRMADHRQSAATAQPQSGGPPTEPVITPPPGFELDGEDSKTKPTKQP